MESFLLEQFPHYPLDFPISWDQKEKKLFERVEGKIRISDWGVLVRLFEITYFNTSIS